MAAATFKVRYLSPWRTSIQCGETLFSADIPSESADALLCFWKVEPELFSFQGPKAFFSAEPTRYSRIAELESLGLRADQVLYHCHPDPRYRVPAVTHRELDVIVDGTHDKNVMTVISNLDSRDNERRKLATHSGVDLYGRQEKWQTYRRWPWSAPALPRNYCGEVPGSWGSEAKLRLASEYRAMICLENTQEPYYFTEKFVDAVRAGCIPIYRAHPTVRDTWLRPAQSPAQWLDPADYRSVDALLRAVQTADREAIAENNRRWFQSFPAKATHEQLVYRRIAGILKGMG